MRAFFVWNNGQPSFSISGIFMSSGSGQSTSVFFSVMLLMVSMFSVQAGGSLAKLLFPLVGPEGATSLRMTIGAVALAFVLKPWRLKISAGNFLPLLIYGIVLGGMNFLFYQSIQRLPLGVAVAFEFTGPLAVALFASRRFIDLLWVGFALVGLVMLFPIGTNAAAIDLIGSLYALGAGFCWAIYIIAGKKTGMSNGAGSVAIGCAIAALIYAPIGFVQAGATIFSWQVLPLALGVGVLSTALPYALEMKALTKLPARTFGTLMSLEPAIGAMSGWLILNEALTTTQWIAISSIVCASLGATLTIKTA